MELGPRFLAPSSSAWIQELQEGIKSNPIQCFSLMHTQGIHEIFIVSPPTLNEKLKGRINTYFLMAAWSYRSLEVACHLLIKCNC